MRRKEKKWEILWDEWFGKTVFSSSPIIQRWVIGGTVLGTLIGLWTGAILDYLEYWEWVIDSPIDFYVGYAVIGGFVRLFLGELGRYEGGGFVIGMLVGLFGSAIIIRFINYRKAS